MKILFLGTLRRLATAMALSDAVPTPRRSQLLIFLGLKATRNTCTIASDVTFSDLGRVRVGEGSFINRGAYIDADVSIGSRVFIGPGAKLLTHHHPIGTPDQRAAHGHTRPVRLGDGAWIGAGAIILPGVTVETGCVVAAGAVVTSHCEANGLYAGVPARRLKDLPSTAPGVEE